jgi:hypothetical protein
MNQYIERPITKESLVLDFAIKYRIPPSQAAVLPALFERASSEADMSVTRFIINANANSELGEYIKSIAITVSSQMEQQHEHSL